jgi:hypothetical protein
MFSFLALLAVRRGSGVPRGWRQAGWALLAALLLYASYGSRTIGIALAGALAGSELVRHRKLTRFAMLVLGMFAGFAILQAVLLTSPQGYLAVAQFSAQAIMDNVVSYAKSLAHAWENGFSRPAQGGLTVVLSGFAALAFWKRIRQGSLEVVIYLAILVTWGAQVGVRGLLPVFPIYLTYVVLGMAEAMKGWRRRNASVLVTAVAVCIGVTYVGGLRARPWQAALANVNDTSAQELFTFLRSQTERSDVLLFSKPRSLALFSERRTASLGPDEPARDSARFLEQANVGFVIQTSWNPRSYGALLSENAAEFVEVFRNRNFRVLRVRRTSAAAEATRE